MTREGANIAGISGSLRADSHNSRLLRAAAELLPPGAELETLDWRELPVYDEDLDTDPAPDAVRRFREAIAAADAVVVSTPEYNASIPGGLKNAIDWASRPFERNPFRDKPVLVVGASTGLFGAVWAQAEVRKVLNHLGADVIDSELPVGQVHENLREDGLAVEPIAAELERQLAALVAQAREAQPERVAA